MELYWQAEIDQQIKELSKAASWRAMPVAGSCRAIDFALSNMSNSHREGSMLTQYNARSLNEH